LRQLAVILFFFYGLVFTDKANCQTVPDFQWGNASYYNISIGESISYQNKEIKLLGLNNHYNQLQVGNDTVWIKVSRRTLPLIVDGVRLFVADNKNVAGLSSVTEIHGLLKKDALICLSNLTEKLLNPKDFLFPVSYNDGFIWKTEETSHMFSYLGNAAKPNVSGGIDINLHDARGIEKHWILAIENSTVMWVKNMDVNGASKETSLLLRSDSYPNIYYLYEHLYNRKVEVKTADKLLRGEPIGTIWGDERWGHLHLAVIKSDTIPGFETRFFNAVNFFPQFYELYFQQLQFFNQIYSKGILKFGQRNDLNGGAKNTIAFEEYSGKGWILGDWNLVDKVESVAVREQGNARLRKELFQGEKASCRNPNDYFDFEINVRNGVYRIRAKVGDLKQASWQKVEFEGIEASTYTLAPGVLKWTSEKVVKVTDSRLTIRIYVDKINNKVAGLNEIVFQRAY